MSRRLLAAAFIGALLVPSAAGATTVGLASLDSGPMTITYSHDVGDVMVDVTSNSFAEIGPPGGVSGDSEMNADSSFTAEPGDISFMSEASGILAGVGEFGAAVGDVAGDFVFSNPNDDLEIVVMMELTRMFALATEFAGDMASGATSLSLMLLSEMGAILPMVAFGDPSCDASAIVSVSGGADFSDSCSTTATFTFAGLAAGDYTLTIDSSSSVELVSQVPVPAAFGLFGLGLIVLGLRRKIRDWIA